MLKMAIHGNLTPLDESPVKDSLTCMYNGMEIKIFVKGASIKAVVTSVETCFRIETTMNKSRGSLTWRMLLQEVIDEAYMQLLVIANNQIVYLRGECVYYVH